MKRRDYASIYRFMVALFVASLAALFVAWVIAEPFVIERRRAKLRSRPFSAQWREILERRVPYARLLPPDLRRQLEGHMQVFLAEKSFAGCGGLEMTDEVRVTIAAQACLLILNRKTDYYPSLTQILVYPGAFIIERLRAEPSGVLQEQRQALSGESWTHGQVVVSWEDALEGAAIVDDGRNVVIHEFAHQLDQQKGYANGAPWLGRRDRYARWSQVMLEEFARLQQQAATGGPSLFSYYGASSPAEFFAVVSEVFFEQPREMAALHPALYAELRSFYRVDPATFRVE
ncbi:MAG TPA: M90 family metallopeptidase [Usitatibacter sp.]